MSSTQILSGNSFRALLLKDLLYNVAVPYILYVFLIAQHFSMLIVLLIAAIPPVLINLKTFANQRRISLIGVLALAGIAIGLCGFLLFKDVRLSLLSGSLTTGFLGLVLLVSLLFGRPLLSLVALDIQARNDPTRREYIMQNTRFLSFMHLLTLLWGITLVAEFVARIILAYTLSLQQFILAAPFVQYGIFGLGLLCTLVYIYMRKRSKPSASAVQQVGR